MINIIEHADPSAFPILDIILILISPSLIANNTLVNAVNFAVANKWDGQCILGIRCRKANMERDLGRLAETQNLPRMGPPLSQCKSEDDALYLIAEEIRAIVE